MLYTPENIANLVLPSDSKFRQYKLILDNHAVIKVMKSIRKPDDLKELLLKFQPAGLFVSVSKFYSPQNVCQKKKNWCKAGYRIAQNIFIDGELVIDFDEGGFDEVKKAANILISEFGIDELDIVETGRGHHLWAKNFSEKLCTNKPKNVFELENYYSQRKRKVLWHLKTKGVIFDFNVSRDNYRVVRVKNSIYRSKCIEKYCEILRSLPVRNDSIAREIPKKIDDVSQSLGLPEMATIGAEASHSLVCLASNEPPHKITL